MHYCSCPTVRDWIAVYPALFLYSCVTRLDNPFCLSVHPSVSLSVGQLVSSTFTILCFLFFDLTTTAQMVYSPQIQPSPTRTLRFVFISRKKIKFPDHYYFSSFIVSLVHVPYVFKLQAMALFTPLNFLCFKFYPV